MFAANGYAAVSMRDIASAVGEEAFVQAGVFFLTGYLQNTQVVPLLKVLECERFHNEDADRA